MYSVIPVKDQPDLFLVNYGDKLGFLKWDGKSKHFHFEVLGQPDPEHPYPEYIFNIATIAPHSGALLFSSCPRVIFHRSLSDIPFNEATLFSISSGRLTKLFQNYGFGESFEWSYNGRNMYFTDSKNNITYDAVYNYETNSIGNELSQSCGYTEMVISGYFSVYFEMVIF